MKAIKQFICLLVCFVLLSSSLCVNASAAVESVSDVLGVYSLEDLNPYAVSPLADVVPAYDWLPKSNFVFSDAILNGKDFILYDDLPYGLDTIVICLSYGSTVLLFFLNGDDSVVPTFTETWASNNGQCRIHLMSMSPIYRLGLSSSSGKAISLLSYTGLTNGNNTTTVIGDKTFYGFAYTLAASDMYVSLTNNAKDMDKVMSLNGETVNAEYGTFVYPTQRLIDQQIEKEQSQTSKNIWETLKSVLDYIINLPSNIANSIKEFFTNLGDRIGDFFTTLKNYILYFQAEKPEDEGVISSSDVFGYLVDYVDSLSSNLSDFTDSLDSSFENIEGYISTGSSVINRLLNGVPILNAVLIFFLVFAVSRKVVGR